METIDRALQYAMEKLSNDPKSRLEQNILPWLACMSIRFGIWGIMDHSIATALLSSYMATAIHFGEDRIRMFAYYVPEPILAEAACRLIHGFTGNGPSATELGIALEQFEESLVSGLVDAGNIGELTARITLALAYDKLCLDTMQPSGYQFKYFSDPVPLQDFIDLLVPWEYRRRYNEKFGIDCFDVRNKSCERLLPTGVVAFTSFELVDSTTKICLTETFLRNAFAHRIAYVGCKVQAGCDLIIPVRFKKTSKTFSYSAVIIQFKNYDDPIDSQEKRFRNAGQKLTPEYCSDENTISD
jgi:hypothetical protein